MVAKASFMPALAEFDAFIRFVPNLPNFLTECSIKYLSSVAADRTICEERLGDQASNRILQDSGCSLFVDDRSR
jgi:hypothetical protein